ncbi:MAG: aldo/keto reductase [Opitutales bacterium]|nr:aldo/keto reductase [Opitutales bacterium]
MDPDTTKDDGEARPQAQDLAWGILGTGNIARKFAAGVQGSRTGRLAAVGSRSSASARAFADSFDIDSAHGSYEALLADPEVDAVYISTPHPMHARWAIAAAEAGKHILCEKPLTLNFAEAAAVVDAARRNGVFLMEAFMYRCHPQTAKLVELIRSGAVGEVQLIEASFSFRAPLDLKGRLFSQELGGGGILDVGGYPVSMARLIAGAALGQLFADPLTVTGAGVIGAESRVDEWAVASLSFSGGILAQLTSGVRMQGQNVVRVRGTEGWLEVPQPWVVARDGGEAEIHVHRADGGREVVTVREPRPLYGVEADTVAAHIAVGEAPAMSHADTLGNMRTLDRWREAIALVYDSERPENRKLPVSGRQLAPASRTPVIPRGAVAGLDKPVSRLVLGVDNQHDGRAADVMFDAFFEHGGNAFDTAFTYLGGQSEVIIGHWMRNRGVRDDVVILDKGAHTPNCFPEKIGEQLAVSLERLQSDFVDIYLMHRDNPAVPVEEFVDALYEQHRLGRLRVYGGSNWSLERIEAANRYARKRGFPEFAAVSNQFSLARMVDPVWTGCVSASDVESRQWFEATGTALLPWSSQARGFFTDRAGPDKLDDPQLARCWYADDNFERRERALRLAAERGVDGVAVALAYVLHQPFPTFPLIGPRTLGELQGSLRGLGLRLSAAELAWLNFESPARPNH